jgi:hypothetical protein
VVTETVFSRVSEVGMRGTVYVFDVVVVGGVLVGVFNDEADWCAGSASFKNAGKYSYSVRLAACCDNVALPRTATVELPLYQICVYSDAGGDTVNNAADSGTVALAEGCQAVDLSE